MAALSLASLGITLHLMLPLLQGGRGCCSTSSTAGSTLDLEPFATSRLFHLKITQVIWLLPPPVSTLPCLQVCRQAAPTNLRQASICLLKSHAAHPVQPVPCLLAMLVWVGREAWCYQQSPAVFETRLLTVQCRQAILLRPTVGCPIAITKHLQPSNAACMLPAAGWECLQG